MGLHIKLYLRLASSAKLVDASSGSGDTVEQAAAAAVANLRPPKKLQPGQALPGGLDGAATETPRPTPTPLGTDFRSAEGYKGARWGMTPNEVQRVVPKGLLKDGNVFVQRSVAGKAATVGYLFTKKRLTRVAILFDEDYMNKDKYAIDYRELKSLLATKYGVPKEDEVVWMNPKSIFKDSPGTAISTGDLAMYASWDTGKTAIELSCSGDNLKVVTKIIYASVELQELAETVSEAEKLSDL